jgi:replication-associated recombination protein RarA
MNKKEKYEIKGEKRMPRTEHYDLFEVLSALQKDIRRGVEEEALIFALELEAFGQTILWNRLKIISSEDIGPANPAAVLLISELEKQYLNAKLDPSRLLFVANAVVCLCRSPKSRIADDLLNVVQLEKKVPSIPDYSLDKHTAKGRKMGRGWKHFFEEGTKLSHEKFDNPYKERHRKLRVLKD